MCLQFRVGALRSPIATLLRERQAADETLSMKIAADSSGAERTRVIFDEIIRILYQPLEGLAVSCINQSEMRELIACMYRFVFNKSSVLGGVLSVPTNI